MANRTLFLLLRVVTVLALLPADARGDLLSAWTGAGGDNNVWSVLNWSSRVPDDDTKVTLDHTAQSTTLDFSNPPSGPRLLESDIVTIGNGIDPVAYNIVSYPDIGEWRLSYAEAFVVKNNATVNFKNMKVYDMHFEFGSTLTVEPDGHLYVWGMAHGVLELHGDLELLLPAEPSAPCIIAEYGILIGQFTSVTGLPPGWSIDYGTGTDDRMTAVPEPTTLLLLGVGVSALLRKRRP